MIVSRTTPAIEAVLLGKRYTHTAQPDEPWAVQGVTLSVMPGELTVLMGPSGSGKTTLLSMLGGLLAPTTGRLNICGERVEHLGEAGRQVFRRRRVGLIFQNYNLLSALTAAENVGVGLALRGGDPAGAADLLRQVGLASKAAAYPHELSGGQRQRVAIARCLAGSPPVLLADEPTAALDAEQGRVVMGLLKRRAREHGSAVVVVTHDARVRGFADRVFEMEDGRLRRIVRRVVRSGPQEVNRVPA